MAVSSVAGERRKELGQFFTPPELVAALTNWAIRAPSDRVIEPAAGEAAFLLAAAKRLRSLGATEPGRQVLGIEIDPAALNATRRLLLAEHETATLFQQDFFDLSPDRAGPVDVVIGNPPYIRYHRFKGEARRKAQLAAGAAGVVLSGLASSWAAFVVHGTQFLGSDGRLAFVLPAELLHADYAGPVRDFLLRRFGSVTVVTFDEAVFPGAMIDAVLLMAERGERGLHIAQLRDSSQLADLEQVEQLRPTAGPRWSRRTAGDGVFALQRMKERGTLMRLGEVASVDIGFVSGANDFFLLSLTEAKEHGIARRLLRPAIARPGQLRGAVLGAEEVEEMLRTDRCAVLALTAPGLDERPTPLGTYLRRGRRRGVHRGYKCRVRSPWYAIPGIRVPDAFMSYMSNVTPRIVLNEAGFSSSNLVHQLTFHITERAHSRAYISALHSSPALLSFEMEGRSYGGGVLKHETREAERVQFPFDPRIASQLADLLPTVDSAIRGQDHGAAAEIVDSLLVREGLLSEVDLGAIREARAELHARRAKRGRTT
ncbi:MAG: HsdM family class I SAM-dependent methyltransferase [Candidatus Limnocylindria bacterium]